MGAPHVGKTCRVTACAGHQSKITIVRWEPTTGDQLSADRSMSQYEIVRSAHADRVQPISAASKLLGIAAPGHRTSLRSRAPGGL